MNLPEDRPKGEVSGLYPLVQGNSCASRSESTCPALVVIVRPSEILLQGAAGDAGSAGRSLIGSTNVGMPSGCDLAAPFPEGGECDQEDCSISQGNGFRSVAGGWETFENITGDQSAAGALGLPSGDYHGQTESLLDTRMVTGASAPFQWCSVVRLKSPRRWSWERVPPEPLRIISRDQRSRCRASRRLDR